MSHARRQAELVMTFHDGASATEFLRDREGVVLHDHSPNGALAIIGARVMSGRAAEALLADLWDEANPIVTDLVADGLRPDAMLLRLIQYIGPLDDVGPGFVVEARWVRLLARFDGVIDIDQYVVETTGQ